MHRVKGWSGVVGGGGGGGNRDLLHVHLVTFTNILVYLYHYFVNGKSACISKY